MKKNNFSVNVANNELVTRSENVTRYLADIRRYKGLTEEGMRDLIKRAQDGDTKAEGLAVSNCLLFGYSIAKHYLTKKLDIMDLTQQASIGLIEAVRMFDLDATYEVMGTGGQREREHVKFLSYALHRMRLRITEFIYNDSRVVRIPINLMKRGGYDYFCSSLNVPTYSDTDTEVIDNLTATYMAADGLFSNQANEVAVESLFRQLTEREKQILSLYYGIGVELPYNYDAIADIVGIGAERVRQIHVECLAKLRGKK